MMTRPPCIVLATLCCVLTIASSAAAECAWVLWAQVQDKGWRGSVDGPRWTRDSAYTSKAECDKAHVIQVERGKDSKLVTREDLLGGKRGLGTNWRCLPDTVDPRGPKAGS